MQNNESFFESWTVKTKITNYEKVVKTKSNISWDSNKTHYYHYEKAIQSFNKKGNTYDNGMYEIKVLKNRIITKYIGDK